MMTQSNLKTAPDNVKYWMALREKAISRGRDSLSEEECNELDIFQWRYDVCSECNQALPIKVCHSAAGYYIGTFCDKDGPYDRHSANYYKTEQEAHAALDSVLYVPRI